MKKLLFVILATMLFEGCLPVCFLYCPAAPGRWTYVGCLPPGGSLTLPATEQTEEQTKETQRQEKQKQVVPSAF